MDLSTVIHLTPKEATDGKILNIGAGDEEGKPKLDLMLPADTWLTQQSKGTWSEIFNPDSLYNQKPFFAALLWYFSILILGWIVYPFVQLAFPNFRFHGYPFAKLIGLLILALSSWLLSSNGLTYSKTTIGLVILGMVIVNGLILVLRRKIIFADIKENWKALLMIEGITLGFFVFFVLVRIGNPDLWHPAKGGEKPMDFSYFNAILKIRNFPPL